MRLLCLHLVCLIPLLPTKSSFNSVECPAPPLVVVMGLPLSCYASCLQQPFPNIYVNSTMHVYVVDKHQPDGMKPLFTLCARIEKSPKQQPTRVQSAFCVYSANSLSPLSFQLSQYQDIWPTPVSKPAFALATQHSPMFSHCIA